METKAQEDNLYTIYVIECEQHKYYVGKTKNLAQRMLEHGKGDATPWTRLHRPLRVIYTEDNKPSSEEDRITKEMMTKYGITNVRGGSYTTLTLDANTITFLEKEVRSNTDACFKCGQNGHYAKNCTPNTSDKSPKLCERCGRNSHNVNRCYAKTHIGGKKIVDQPEIQTFHITITGAQDEVECDTS